jgi:hypothetical protein
MMMRRKHLPVAAALLLLAALLGACSANSAPPVTARTPPDMVQLTVLYTPGKAVSATTVYRQTWTQAGEVRDLGAILNAAPDAQAARWLPFCGSGYPVEPARWASDAQYMWRFVFTAHGQTVERVDMSERCWGVGIRRGFAPTPDTLGVEVGENPAMVPALTALIPYQPQRGTGSMNPRTYAVPPTPTPLP